jgi:ribonuclease III
MVICLKKEMILVDNLRKKELKEFLKKIGARFNNFNLLNLSLSHRSYVNETKNGDQNNERLEFLGDSVLGMVITEYLYKFYPDLNEGELARIKSFVVSEDVLSKITKSINLNDYILIGKGEEVSGGRSKKTILADAFEAFLGSYYLDTNFNKVRDFILKHFKFEIELVINNKHEKDYKTLLQEYVQKKHKVCPVYVLKSENGPEHDKTFYMEVFIRDKLIGAGDGKSKKDAEKVAAKHAYLKITSKMTNTLSDKKKKRRHR